MERKDKANKWEVGNKIHFASRAYKKGRVFGTSEVKKIDHIIVVPEFKQIWINSAEVENKDEFVKKDGFWSEEEFWSYFNKPFTGKVIYWEGVKNV